jgi:NAD(P)-dependent dehydrogenase (short-subunit alcohol dehydrogenase family)
MKNIIVTGGAGGIGSQIVREFVDKGFFVYILDIDDVEAGKICEELGPEKCKYLHADVTDLAQLDALCNQLKSDFQVNHIISLAGRALPGE